MIASSRVASSSPFGARRASGCLATLSQSLPFVQAHDPSAFAHHAGNTDHPYAAYLSAVEASADAAAGILFTSYPVLLGLPRVLRLLSRSSRAAVASFPIRPRDRAKCHARASQNRPARRDPAAPSAASHSWRWRFRGCGAVKRQTPVLLLRSRVRGGPHRQAIGVLLCHHTKSDPEGVQTPRHSSCRSSRRSLAFLLCVHSRFPSVYIPEQHRLRRHSHPRLVEPVRAPRLMRREERFLEILFAVDHEPLPVVVLDNPLPLYLHHLPVEVFQQHVLFCPRRVRVHRPRSEQEQIRVASGVRYVFYDGPDPEIVLDR